MFYTCLALYARESDDKDTAKNVIFNILIILFEKISEKILYLCSAYRPDEG